MIRLIDLFETTIYLVQSVDIEIAIGRVWFKLCSQFHTTTEKELELFLVNRMRSVKVGKRHDQIQSLFLTKNKPLHKEKQRETKRPRSKVWNHISSTLHRALWHQSNRFCLYREQQRSCHIRLPVHSLIYLLLSNLWYRNPSFLSNECWIRRRQRKTFCSNLWFVRCRCTGTISNKHIVVRCCCCDIDSYGSCCSGFCFVFCKRFFEILCLV